MHYHIEIYMQDCKMCLTEIQEYFYKIFINYKKNLIVELN